MAVEPGKIRNVAVVGHRGTGKTSLVEAMLFQAGAANRLGTVESGSTVSDWDEDEQKRQMSLSASVCNLEWQGRKINLVDAQLLPLEVALHQPFVSFDDGVEELFAVLVDLVLHLHGDVR